LERGKKGYFEKRVNLLLANVAKVGLVLIVSAGSCHLTARLDRALFGTV